MQKIGILLLATLLLNSLTAQTIWDDFDNPENIVYNYYDGTGFDQSFPNPSTIGANSSLLCAQYIRNGGVTYDVIVIDPAGSNNLENVSDYISGIKELSIKVYSPSPGLTVQITLEDKNVATGTNYPSGRHSEYIATTTATNDWETLTFSYTNTPDASVSDTSVNRLILLFEPNTSNSTVWHWDDLIGPDFVNPCQGIAPDMSIGDDFECQRNMTYAFANGAFSTSSNPETTGINISSMCGFFKKFPPPTNDGAFGGPLSNPFTTATYNRVHVDLYDLSAPQEFYLILQDASSSTIAETIFTTSAGSDWQTYTLDLSGISSANQIANIVFLLNPATSSEDSIFIDNFKFSFDPSSISKQDVSAKTKIYPNPVTDQFTISSTDIISKINITDLTGKLLYTENPIKKKEYVLNSSFLKSGIYLITIQNDLGIYFSRELIKL